MNKNLEKSEKYNKKNLRSRLSAILTIYLDGLGEKKKKKMDKYLDAKLGDVVNYYSGLLKKKKNKHRVLPPLDDELSLLSRVIATPEEKQVEAIPEVKASFESTNNGSVDFKQQTHLAGAPEKVDD